MTRRRRMWWRRLMRHYGEPAVEIIVGLAAVAAFYYGIGGRIAF
jgi:hypothetical protein